MRSVILITVPHAGCAAVENVLAPRQCDRRALEAALLIHDRLAEIVDQDEFEVVMFPNTTILRELCDLNRFYHCDLYPNIQTQVTEYMAKYADTKRVVMNLDVHSFPQEAHINLRENQHFYTLVLNRSVTARHMNILSNFFRQQQTKIGGPLTVFEASDLNYFLVYFEHKGIYSLLVEFEEDQISYSRERLEMHASMWANFCVVMARVLVNEI
jgi:hypothetical protein